jgi:pimeloyl-ACP methyl ester carboxylesterase
MSRKTTTRGRSTGATTWAPPLPEAPGFAHEVIQTPGLLSHVATIGQGEPILLLHGLPQHWWQWRVIAPALARRGHRVICPDLRGSGWTTASEPAVGRETIMHDLIALLDALQIDRVHLMSHDLGSLSAMQLCYRHPDRVRAAVQLSVPPAFMAFSPKMMPAFKHLPPLIMHRRGQSLRGLFNPAYIEKPLTEHEFDGYLRVQRRPEIDRAVRIVCRDMVVPEALRILRGHHRRQRLHTPTLIVFGRQDLRFEESFVRHICRGAERYAGSFELAFVDDASHFITDDAPDAVADVALEWFAKHGESPLEAE